MFKQFFSLSLMLLLVSCKSGLIETQNAPTKYGDIDVIALEKKKSAKVILFVPDDDTISINAQVEFFKPLLEKRTSLYAFPKYKYHDVIVKDNADNPTLRLELLIAAYQNLVEKGKIDSTTNVVVLGVGEGCLIAPHFSKLVHANELILINPYFHSLKENLTLTFTEPTENSKMLKAQMGFLSQSQWVSFIQDVSENKTPDRSAGPRTYRYYSNYWGYYPGKIYQYSKIPVKLLIFKSFLYSSQFEKEFLMQIKNPNFSAKTLEGSFYSRFSYTELKKLAWF